MGFQMALWLLITMGLAALMFLWNKRKAEKSEKVGSVDDFSNFTMFFDPIKGEGHLFVGGSLVIFCFSMFLFELAKIFKGIMLD